MAYLNVNSKKIYYEVHGEGVPLIILNGIMMNTVSWHMFLSEFKNYQLILLDFLDQGQSDSMTTNYTHQVQVEVIKALVDALKIEALNLVGISYGAEIALQYALNNQSQIKTLVIFNGAPKTSSWLKDIGIAWQLAARTYNSELFYHVAIPYIYSSEFYSKNEDWFIKRKDLLLKAFQPEFLDRMDRLIQSSESYDIIEDLGSIKCKTIIVAGDCDYITPIYESKLLHQCIQGSFFSVLEGCGHASMYEKPMEFVSIIQKAVSDSKE